MDEAADCELLEDSLENATLVTVRVAACRHRCCGGGWQRRGAGTYTGRVLSIDVDEFLLECPNDLGKVAEVIAGFGHLQTVNPLVD